MKGNFGKKLKSLLKRGDQTRLAVYLDISPQSVQQWTTGETTPELDKIPRIAEFIRVPKEDLLELLLQEDDEHPPANNIAAQDLGIYTASSNKSGLTIEESKAIDELLESIGANLKTASVNQLMAIKKILEMQDNNVSNTHELIELIGRIIRDVSSKK